MGHGRISYDEHTGGSLHDHIAHIWQASRYWGLPQSLRLLSIWPAKLYSDFKRFAVLFPPVPSHFDSLLDAWFSPNNTTPCAYLVDTSEEALLFPDWLKLRMIRSTIDRLVDAGESLLSLFYPERNLLQKLLQTSYY